VEMSGLVDDDLIKWKWVD